VTILPPALLLNNAELEKLTVRHNSIDADSPESLARSFLRFWSKEGKRTIQGFSVARIGRGSMGEAKYALATPNLWSLRDSISV